jgi:hypothetical protein
MKKLFLLTVLAFPLLALAADDTPLSQNCIQVIQSAVSPDGVCEIFPTPCSVPTDWRKISSCDLIAPKDSGASLTELDQRRRMQRIKKIQQKVRKQKQEKNAKKRAVGAPRVGRARFTKDRERTNTNFDIDSKNRASHYTQRGRNIPKFGNASSYQRFKKLNVKSSVFGQGLTRVEKYQQKIEKTGRRRPSIMGSTDAKREGYLTGDSFLRNQNDHIKETPLRRYWKSLDQVNRKKKKRRVYEGPRLQKIYRPSFEGNLDGSNGSE